MKKLLVVLFLVLAACGKRGDPRPPVPVIPQATKDLLVAQRGQRVLLTWSYPSLTTSGQSLQEIQRVVVYRATEELPVPAAGRDPDTMQPGDVDPTIPRPLALFSRLPGLTPMQFLKLRTKVDSIEGSALPGATAGAKLMFEDSPAFTTRDGRPVRLTYAVVTESETADSDVSNLVTIVPLTVPAPPPAVSAEAKAEGIVISWQKPPAGATPDVPPFLAGYNIYRRAKGLPEETLGAPVNPAPVMATTYTDVPAYGEYSYVVRSVSSAGPPLIESDPSVPATAAFKDLLPPPTPANLAALRETRSVRLIWDPVSAPDLKGYLVYRTQGGTRVKLTPQPVTTAFFVNDPEPGVATVYSVTSVDASGNESAPVATEEIIVPRVP